MGVFKIFKKNKKDYKTGIDVSIGKSSKIGTACEIGNYTYIGNFCEVTRATIGNYVSIANNVTIGPGEHPTDTISAHHFFMKNPYEEMTAKDCTIGNDVWIGVNSVVRRGVKIGNGAIVGANSYVNKDVPDFAIVAGSPAKLIRYKFSKEIIGKIIESKWWEKNANEAKIIVNELQKQLI